MLKGTVRTELPCTDVFRLINILNVACTQSCRRKELECRYLMTSNALNCMVLLCVTLHYAVKRQTF